MGLTASPEISLGRQQCGLDSVPYAGTKRIPAGRKGEGPAIGLAKTLEDAGFRMGRLRTGTPPRLRASTIDYTGLGTQPSDTPAAPFSFMNSQVKHEGNFVTCHMTNTNKKAHQYVLGRRWSSGKLVPLMGGADTLEQNFHIQQDATGPRYCPSIESKVRRGMQGGLGTLVAETCCNVFRCCASRTAMNTKCGWSPRAAVSAWI